MIDLFVSFTIAGSPRRDAKVMIPQIIKYRQGRRLKRHGGKLGLFSALVISLVMLASAIAAAWYYFGVVYQLPSIDTIPALLEPPNGSLLEPTRFYDRAHAHVLLTLQNPAAAGRQYLRVSAIRQPGESQFSNRLVEATISAMDPGFWQEPGYTIHGIRVGAHPTLAQRLVADLLLYGEQPSLQRNLQERILAMQLTAQYGREKVLEWYLNSASYGEFIYGADAAAWVYLGKPATQLTIAEAALLAAIGESPGIDPWADSLALRSRRDQVVQGMVAGGWIRQAEAEQALMEDLRLQPKQVVASAAPEFTNLALLQLSAVLPLERLYRGGYQVVTTLDDDVQEQAGCATQVQLERLKNPGGQVDAAMSDCEAAALLPTLQLSPRQPLEAVQTSLILLDPQAGQVLAWVGGDAVDPAPSMPPMHPAGTILSPFLYLTAFSRGMSPGTSLWDLPLAGSEGISPDALAAYHGPVRLRIAMLHDYAGAADQLLQQLGMIRVWQTEQKFGISLQPGLIPTGLDDLYSQPASLLEGVQAYGILANHGILAGRLVAEPSGLIASTILRVESVGGQVIQDWSASQRRAIVSDELAYLATDVLAGIHGGEPGGIKLQAGGQPAAIKSSLADSADNSWTIGYTPQLAFGIWMGDPAGGLSAEITTGLWQAVMAYASQNRPLEDFGLPEGIRRLQVCDPSGLLATDACPAKVEEVFLAGTEPTQADSLYQEYLVDRETGLLATVFTPASKIEKETFMVWPGEAHAWASAAGVPAPPASYDAIEAAQTGSDHAKISAPGMSAIVHGKVDLFGSASGEGFGYYRLEVGQGLNPQEWALLGEDVRQPVDNGRLGSWDTSGLSGDYVVELLVVRKDQQADRAFLVLNVDNTPPAVRIVSPQSGAAAPAESGEALILRAEVSDNLAVARVEFWLDGELESTLYEPPYWIPWTAQPGVHTLEVFAFDAAGNETHAQQEIAINK